MAKKQKPNFIQNIKRFWRETVGELRKVSWPTMPDAIALTRVVLIVTFLMSVILGLMDFVFGQLIGFLFRA